MPAILLEYSLYMVLVGSMHVLCCIECFFTSIKRL